MCISFWDILINIFVTRIPPGRFKMQQCIKEGRGSGVERGEWEGVVEKKGMRPAEEWGRR
jgi:hypothetical protein